MPITKAFWNRDRALDLHVLMGQSTPDLSAAHVAVTKTDGNKVFARAYLNDPANGDDVSLVFKPRIKGVANGDFFEGGGVKVNTKTGVVQVLAPLPSPHLRNFILVAEVTNKADLKTYSLSIRIHVHRSVTSFWLTPETLTIRPNGTARPDKTQYVFTARAQFDDDSLGDVTEDHGITWTPATLFESGGRIVLRVGDNSGGPPITVTAQLPAALGGASATAELNVAQPWGAPTQATLVVGGGWPGTIDPATVPNILFVGDGFADFSDRDRFAQLTNSIVERIKTNHLSAPFDALATSINFWRAPLPPSSVRGISVLCEVSVLFQDGELRAFPVANAKKPPAAGAWTLENVVYAAGLPVWEDNAANAARTDAKIREDWGKLYDPDPSPQVTDLLLARWRRMSNRTFIEEKDSPFCMAYGKTPQVDQLADSLFIDFHPRRLKRRRDAAESQSRFDLFLGSLRGTGGLDLSSVWAEQSQMRPANYDFVFILASCKWDRGGNRNGYIAMNVEDRRYLTGISQVPGKKALFWNPPPATAHISGARSARAVHEIAHSFGLGDEYGGEEPTFTGTADSLKPYGNLQAESEVRDIAGDISGERIKWNWLRARKGALVTEILPAGADSLIIKVQLGHGLQFAIGDTLILRKRQFPRPLGKDPDESSLLTVAQKPTADTVVVNGSIPLGNFFDKGDVLYLPTAAPASVRSPIYPFAEMVALNIKQLITAEKRSLSADPCSVAQSLMRVQVPNLGSVVTPLSSVLLPTIVGLYDGGKETACGIFHPAGDCIMNGDAELRSFCPVCRYILVEVINPFAHFANDLKYDRLYPQS